MIRPLRCCCYRAAKTQGGIRGGPRPERRRRPATVQRRRSPLRVLLLRNGGRLQGDLQGIRTAMTYQINLAAPTGRPKSEKYKFDESIPCPPEISRSKYRQYTHFQFQRFKKKIRMGIVHFDYTFVVHHLKQTERPVNVSHSNGNYLFRTLFPFYSSVPPKSTAQTRILLLFS